MTVMVNTSNASSGIQKVYAAVGVDVDLTLDYYGSTVNDPRLTRCLIFGGTVDAAGVPQQKTIAWKDNDDQTHTWTTYAACCLPVAAKTLLTTTTALPLLVLW